jgi:hypothetical protein
MADRPSGFCVDKNLLKRRLSSQEWGGNECIGIQPTGPLILSSIHCPAVVERRARLPLAGHKTRPPF